MVKLPTGDESPKGFEGYFADKRARDEQGAVRLDCVSVSQLAGEEIAALDALRERALANFTKTTGHEVVHAPIMEELARVPEGKSLSDKLVFRAFHEGHLVAYVHVICGWPKNNEWTIEQLLLDPEHRLQGIGTKLIQDVESLAETAEVRATSILSIPSRPGSDSFWSTIGYEDKTQELGEQVSETYGYKNIMQKKI